MMLDPNAIQHLSEAAVAIELETPDMTLNIGPQHPSTHGVLRLVAKVDGEQVHDVQPVIGYMHRGYEKLSEVRTYPQIVSLINRIEWVSGYANEIPFLVAVERIMGLEVPERAQFIRLILTEMTRLSSHLMFMGAYPLELGASTPLMYALRERERVLDPTPWIECWRPPMNSKTSSPAMRSYSPAPRESAFCLLKWRWPTV
jgi:NADH-quinone oxidoreductase subunit D